MPDFEIICVGAAKFDVIAEIDAFPHEDERILAQTITDAVGGASSRTNTDLLASAR